MIRKFTVSAVAALASAAAFATTDLEHKGRVVASVATAHAGVAEVTCNDPGGWKFAVVASQDAGRDVVTVRLASESAAQPPRFGVYVRMSGAGVRNVWISDYARDGCHLWPKLWWGYNSKYASQLAYETPVAVGLDNLERSPVAIACSEAFSPLEFGLYADDSTCEVVGRCEFFAKPSVALREYEVSVLLDRRGLYFADAVRQCSEWIASKNGFASAKAPEAAFDPLYSTWYAYLQDVSAKELEAEAVEAAALGMKTMILDDGWQKIESATFYSATGDWMPIQSRFPDMKAHVARVHDAGLKYMLWLAVPYVGDESKAWDVFKDKALMVRGAKSPGRIAILDPRFPEVREYLIRTYERVVGEWDFDGVKLDFIDQFVQPAADPAARDGFAGRDYRSVPEAVDRLMKDVLSRLRAIKPDVLVEFRQHYMGPAILQYGNMMRAADCPADLAANRRRICDLRLTSGDIAVHSDMLVWSRDESPEGAALPILNTLYSTIQYSMALKTLSPAHRDVIRHWIAFSQRHREALLKGAFRPHHPENGYTWVEGESASERVVTAYVNDVCVRTGAADRTVLLVNATGGPEMTVDFSAGGRVELFDVFGKPTGMAPVSKGIVRLAVPASGFARVIWSAEGTCGGVRYSVSDGVVWRDNESAGRSGHMGHALVDCGNGRILDFTSNCAGMERASGHSGYGWMEYRISEDYGRSFGPVRVLPCSKKMYDGGRHTALCEKAVRAPDGRIVLFFQITDASLPGSCEPWSEPLMSVSDDDGETFSDFLPTGADAGRIYDAVCDDRYVYFITQANPNFPGRKPEHVYKVYRAGADLKFAPSVLPIDPVGRGYGALEFAEDGALHAYAYNSLCETEMDVTISRDRGETWSEPRKSRVALKIRNPQVRRIGGAWFLMGRNGGFGRGDALVLYTSADGVDWDGGFRLDVRPEGSGTGYYGCMLPIFEPGQPPRMLMQYSRPYRDSCVNVMHRTITLHAIKPRGAICLSFDDRNFDAWERCLPLFAKYGAHATFFVSGPIDARAEACMKRLSAAGHSVGLHGQRHMKAADALRKRGEEAYLRDEILPQLSVCREKGIPVRSFAYPCSDRTDETDALLLRYFGRLRTGAAKTGVTFPMAEAPGRRLLVGMPAGSPDDAPDRIMAMVPTLAAESKVLVCYAHDIEKPGTSHDCHNLGEVDLERILVAAKAAGVAVVGMDELCLAPRHLHRAEGGDEAACVCGT
ncbi:MAG: alpha-galactosidase [Kiritimatiellae bacterium]|nr:alpha-galactosidase [Kiritimatiellia bacterium]